VAPKDDQAESHVDLDLRRRATDGTGRLAG
jgi:hypothetical protein